MVNLNGGVLTDVTLDNAGSATGYSALTINSAGPGGTTANDLFLDIGAATNTAAMTVTGAEFLFLSGNALNIDNLHTFTANSTTAPDTPDTGGVNVFFTNDDGLGHVAAVGGSGVNTFEFGETATDAAGFTSASTVDGGTGTTNTLIIDAGTGAILLPGVGPNITDIATVEHSGFQTGALTADLALMGSATTFDLGGDYNALVTVTDITNAMTVEYSGTSVLGADVVLEHTTPLGGSSVINFEMNGVGPGPLTLNELDVATGLVSLNINSIGTASDNVIDNVSHINNNVIVTGATHLTFGSEANPYTFTGTAVSGAVIDASADTGGVEAWLGRELSPNFPNPTQTFIGGTGNDTAHVLNFEATVVDFSKGGSDIVDFHEPRDSGAGLLSNTPATDGSTELYNSVVGWTTANDTIQITNGPAMNDVQFTNGGLATAPTSILSFNTGAIVDASAEHDNYIKINTPAVTTGATATQGFDTAIGAGGSVHTAATGEFYLASFYDTTHTQAVFVTAESVAGSLINNTSTVDVVGLVHMSAADYAALGTASVHFA